MAAEPGTPSLIAAAQIASDLPDAVQATITSLQSRALREAVAERCRETPKFPAKHALYAELIENIARGEMLRLLPLEIQSRIFSFIGLEERLRVLETISGGQGESGNKQTDFVRSIWKKISRKLSVATAGQRVQANFRRAVLETYKSVKTIKDLGPKCSKLKLLQTTGGQLENLQIRFPKLQVNLDASELQGYIYIDKDKLRIIHLNGLKIDFHFIKCYYNSHNDPYHYYDSIGHFGDDEVGYYEAKFLQMDSTSVVMLISWHRYDMVAMFNLNLIDMSARECCDPRALELPDCLQKVFNYNTHTAMLYNDFLYVPGCPCSHRDDRDRHRYVRYNIPSNTWEHIAHMNHIHTTCQFVTWNDSLYAVGGAGSHGAVERYDSENDKWTVVFKQDKLEESIYSAIVVEGILYCCVRSNQDRENRNIWGLDMRTGEECVELQRGLPELYPSDDYPFRIAFFAKEGHVSLLLTELEKAELKWETFVLDRSESTWRSMDSGSTPNNNEDINYDDVHSICPLFL